MSWQSYVDDQLVGTGHIGQAAILGHDGNPWATSAGWGLKAGEGQAIAGLYKNPSNVFAAGVTVAGAKYLGIKGDERSIYGKKGATGVIMVKTNQAILVAVYNEQQQPGNAANVVEKLADYLLESGY